MDESRRDALDKAMRITGAVATDKALYVMVRHPDGPRHGMCVCTDTRESEKEPEAS